MNEHELNTLIQQVHRLEHTTKWWRGITVVALSLMAALLLMGQAPRSAQSIAVEELFLRDSTGTPRAKLGLVDGSPAFSMVDKAGRVRMGLLLAPDGSPTLTMYDQPGKARMMLSLKPDGSPSMSMADSAGNIVLLLSAKADGSRISFGDKMGHALLTLSLSQGYPSITLRDSNDKERLSLIVFQNQASLDLTYGEQRFKARLATTPDGTPYMHILNNAQQVIWKAP